MKASPANSTTQSITVPIDAITGDVLMRVLSVWGSTPSTDAYSTTAYRWGEIEEYTIRISAALPVELLYFEGVQYSSFNSLKWATASEQNSSHFIIEKSIDGETWKEITSKPAAGNSTTKINYYYLDNINQFTLHYYRLIQYDIDGRCIAYGPISIDNRRETKKIVKWVNLLGQEVGEYEKGIVFIVYVDGSTKKVIR